MGRATVVEQSLSREQIQTLSPTVNLSPDRLRHRAGDRIQICSPAVCPHFNSTLLTCDAKVQLLSNKLTVPGGLRTQGQGS